MRTALLIFITVWVGSCANLKAEQPDRVGGEIPEEVGPNANATLVVLQSGVVGAEHVETERLTLLSRSFRSALAKSLGVKVAPGFSVYRLGKSEVLRIVVPGEDRETALTQCQAIINVAFSNVVEEKGNGIANEWLEQQHQEAKERLLASEKEYRSFKEQNNVLVVSAEEQLKMAAQLVQELMLKQEKTPRNSSEHEALEEKVARASERAMQFDRLAMREKMLRREVETNEAIVKMIAERKSQATLESLLHPKLRVLDVCSFDR
jgi:hypothetical protein